MIIARDIEDVGLAIGIAPTEKAVTYVLDNYKRGCSEDPTASFDIVIENLLNEFYWEVKSDSNRLYIEQLNNNNYDTE